MPGVLRKNVGFLYLTLKIKFDTSNNGKMLWCSYFRSFIKSVNLDRYGNLIEKINFVSTPWKIIIPIAHHPPYNPPNTPSPTTPPTLTPPLTSTNSTTLTLTPPPHPTPHQHTTQPTTTTHPTTTLQ